MSRNADREASLMQKPVGGGGRSRKGLGEVEVGGS